MSDHLYDFVKSITPEPYDRSVVAARRGKIEACLAASRLDAGLFRESGSWSHGTAVRGKSDVDYMAWASGPQPALPSSALTAAKNVLLDNRDELGIWDVHVSTPVVQVEFLMLPFIEIALGWWVREVRGFNVFRIGGRRDEWVDSAPAAHLQYVNEQNDRLDKRLKPLIRLLKAWKLHVGAPISSFYLEMRAAKYASSEEMLLLDLDLRYLMSDLARVGLPDMNDPQEIVGRIPACSSDANRRHGCQLLNDAADSLVAAAEAEEKRDPYLYWSYMSDLFGPSFPIPAW